MTKAVVIATEGIGQRARLVRLLTALPAALLLVGCVPASTAAPGSTPAAIAALATAEATPAGAATVLAPTPALPATPASLEVAPTATPPASTAALALEPREVSRGDLARREIALTFDCGGHAGPTRAILDALREADVRVTFFMIGDWVRAYPELAREIAERHELAHHSMAHPDYVTLTDAAIIDDLERGERAILEVTGQTTRPLWRAPSGSRDARVLSAAARAGWPQHIFWTLDRDGSGALVSGDPGDWRGLTAAEVAANLERAAALGNGVITVQHCDSAQTAATLADSLRALAARGLRVVTVSELLRP